MNNQLVLATEAGIVIMEKAGDSWEEHSSACHQHRFTAVTSREDVILAGMFSLGFGRVFTVQPVKDRFKIN